MKFSDLELAFEFVSSAPPFENEAYVQRSTGLTFYRSDMAGEDDVPEGAEDDDDFVEVPHKNDLDLGQRLVWRFVNEVIPDKYDEVRDIFSGRGAYGRYKALLGRLDLLDRWYDFEGTAETQALRDWCTDVGLELED